MKRKATKISPYTIELTTGNTIETVPVIVRKHARSRHMVVRYNPTQHHVRLTLPRYVTIKQGLRFVEEKRAWLEQRIREKSSHIPFEHGSILPILGMHYTLHHTGGRGVVRIEGEQILVPGEREFMDRRVREFLKRVAADTITELAREKAKLIERKVKRVSMRDTSSRWGSCSYDGNLSFSWRLIFAPFDVLEYVTCHEVAHLKHHDHSPAFWAVVATLFPKYIHSRQWLKEKGPELYAYG